MNKITLYMKSGNKIEFECEEMEKTENGLGELVRLSWTNGNSNKRLLKVTLENIEGIVAEDN